MVAQRCGLTQTLKKLIAFFASAKHSKRKWLLTPNKLVGLPSAIREAVLATLHPSLVGSSGSNSR
jgi:hypothetical protein